MKLDLYTLTLATMALGVTALPAADNNKARDVSVHKVRGVVGGLVVPRDHDDDDDSSYSSTPSYGESYEAEAPSMPSYGDYYQAAQTTGSGSSPTGSGSTPTTTGSGSGSGGSSGGSIPASSGSSALAAVKTIAAGESFDGGMYMFDRGVSCTSGEGGGTDAVFALENGASLSNVIIGPNQIEGIHCQGSCSLTNVWWSAVCEDAFTIKEQGAGETTTISGGGAYGASDKVMQHNGGGTMSITGFTVEDFGKLYRSCGNCDSMYERHVVMSDITASSGDLLAGINSNYGDTAKISGVSASGVGEICERFEGNDSGDEPTSIGAGNDGTSCIIS